ncbi:uncharacterized protein LOC123312257 isoform X2 [Coccinella septempunctata]|uniref:uncharacterized protein LOC123312257 isoform X2 n=1 Tax=Coccinella septempunctata TaxID=41139 RepID=UPI001D063F6C|nr:uncharacterized protein LOC123312257 isoform X2 [Coccinella septempunctata]
MIRHYKYYYSISNLNYPIQDKMENFECPRIWNVRKLPTTLESGKRWAIEQKLLPSTPPNCPRHRRPTREYSKGEHGCGMFRCTKCNWSRSITANSFLSHAHIRPDQLAWIAYGFAWDWSHRQLRNEAVELELPPEQQTEYSESTISAWYHYCREMIIDHFDLHLQNMKLGGPGKIVQIDESKFGRRKYNRGRRVEGHWVLGMIEDGSEEVAMMVVEFRDAHTLTEQIRNYILPGTTIHTDMWRGYNLLSEAGYVHRRVNHSDPENPFIASDGTHTQRIESTWRPAKNWFRNKQIPADQFPEYLIEYLWRRHIRKRKLDPMEEVLKAIRYFYPF